MVNIKDLEEKKRIVAYCMVRNGKGIGVENIWRTWSLWWEDDFKVAGYTRLLKPYMGNMIYPLSKIKMKQGEQPVICEEYTTFINEIIDWLTQEYKTSRKANIAHFRKLLDTYRENCYRTLIKEFKGSEYKVQNCTLKEHPLHLGRYRVVKRNGDNKAILLGSFDTVIDFINSTNKNLQEETE